ncbi:MAG: outer membrane beta-barrel protein [Bacteriovoracales bacterium]
MKKYLILIFTFYSLNIYAGLLLEPYVGFDFSTYGKTENGNLNVDWRSFEFGGRIGYIWDTFMVGVDIDSKDKKVEYGPNDQDTEISNRGVFAGWNWEDWALRLKYYFNADWRIQGGSSYSGNGFGLDVAYRIKPNISINLEFTRITYDNFENDGDLETHDILIAVSFPFDLVTK